MGVSGKYVQSQITQLLVLDWFQGLGTLVRSIMYFILNPYLCIFSEHEWEPKKHWKGGWGLRFLQHILDDLWCQIQKFTCLSHDGLNPAHVPYWRVNNPTLWDFCVSMIGRADIEGSKSNVAMNAWLPQASYPCGNFSDTSSWIFLRPKGSIGHQAPMRRCHPRVPQADISPQASLTSKVTVSRVDQCEWSFRRFTYGNLVTTSPSSKW